MPAKTYKALGLLLCYPSEDMIAGSGELVALMEEEGLVTREELTKLKLFAEQLQSVDLLEAQEEYVDTFDRVRSLSLHLFEHVHGESRERGQAMVDLADRYAEQGMTLGASELPDFLPAFLEYLSLLPEAEAREELSDAGHIVAAVGKRLAERGSKYHLVMDAVMRLAGRTPQAVLVKGAECPSFDQIDKEWEEKPIDFLAAGAPSACSVGGCGGCGGNNGISPQAA